MTPPRRDTTEGRVYLDLSKQAKHEGRPFQELLTLYTLEGFLARLAVSRYVDRLVVKGGLLLAAYDLRRPTQDADLASRGLPADGEAVCQVVREICDVRLDDGLHFDISSARWETIREEEAASGIRVRMTCSLGKTRTFLKADVNVGDPIAPGPVGASFPVLLDRPEPITVLGYPLSMVLAEKLVTALDRGVVNTRWRDFADIYLLAHRHVLEGAQLAESVAAVAGHRGVEPGSLAEILDGFAAAPEVQDKWATWRARLELAPRLPLQFGEVLAVVISLGDPVFAGQVGDSEWRPEQLRWVPTSQS